MKQTPEQRAKDRFPFDIWVNSQQRGYSAVQRGHFMGAETIFREEVEPLELKVQEQADEVAKLRALVQVLERAGNKLRADGWTFWDELAKNGSGWFPDPRQVEILMRAFVGWDTANKAAKEAGFTPTTNTTEG